MLILAVVIALVVAGAALTIVLTRSESTTGGGNSGGGKSGPGDTFSPGSADGLKPQLVGFLDEFNVPKAAYRPVLAGWVVGVKWSDLQPSPNGPLDTSGIDGAIATALQLNTSGGTQLRLKLRVFAGSESPDWAKQLGGPAGHVTNNNAGQVHSGNIPRFWSEPFGLAWDALQTQLAARYDTAPEIADVVISRCTTIFDEPLVRQTNDKATVQNLVAAGYTDALDNACQHRQIEQAGAVWTHTRLSMSFSPYQRITSAGATSKDNAYTAELMGFCRSTLGPRCTLGNNELGRDVFNGQPERDSATYTALRRHGTPLYFQVESGAFTNTETAFVDAIQLGVDEGANYVELNPKYTIVPPARLGDLRSKLAANPHH